METIRIEGVITVLTPLHHGGDEKSGSEVLLRRTKYIVDGRPVEVPYIEGNAIRGYLRRLVAGDFLRLVGYDVKRPRLYHMLYAGGVLEEVEPEETSKLDVQLRRRVRALLPLVSLFGGSIANQAFTGKLIVGKALPICRELNDYLPYKSDASFYTYLDFAFATRRDERDAPGVLVDKEGKYVPVQMLYRYEVFVPGTRFYHWFALQDTNDVEKALFARMLELWGERPYIGGRIAIGGGRISFKYDGVNWSSQPYLKFIEENRDAIVKLLEELDK